MTAAVPATGHIADGRHVLALRVYYEDTDAGGIVYYANYLRFLERGRTELLRQLGEEHSALRQTRGINWTVRRCAIEYLRPARLDEAIEVTTEIATLRGASVEMLQTVRRDGDLLISAELMLACMNDAGRPVRLPEHLRRSLAAIVARPVPT